MYNPTSATAKLAGILSLTILAGCSGGAQIAPPVSGSSAYVSTNMLQRASGLVAHPPAQPVERSQHVALAPPIVYVSDFASPNIMWYNNPLAPTLGSMGGTLPQVPIRGPQSMCVDGAGNIFVTAGDYNGGNSHILIYQSGTTNLIGVLNDPNAYPTGCAVNDTLNGGGGVAVANYPSPGSTTSNIAYYQYQGTVAGVPTFAAAAYYTSPAFKEFDFIGYDYKANLWIDGKNAQGAFRYGVLPLHNDPNATIIPVTITGPGHAISRPGPIKYDKSLLESMGYMAVEDRSTPSKIYRVDWNSRATSVSSQGPIVLPGTNTASQFDIRKIGSNPATTYVVVADYGNGQWKSFTGYPNTLTPGWVLNGGANPGGIVISP